MTDRDVCLGTICVLDFQPRSFEERQIRVLSDLADEVRVHLRYRRQNWMLDAIFEELHIFTGVLDPDGTLLRANRTAMIAVGASPGRSMERSSGTHRGGAIPRRSGIA